MHSQRGEHPRRSQRLSTDLFVRFRGSLRGATLCRGNLGMTGVYVATSELMGAPDDVVELALASVDRQCEVEVLARVARVVRQDDSHRGARVIGAAFEFLPAHESPAGIAQLITHSAELELGATGSLVLDAELAGVLRSGSAQGECSVRSFGPDWLNLTTTADVELAPGAPVDVALQQLQPGLTGRVASAVDVEVPGVEEETGRLVRRVRVQVSEAQRGALLELAQRALLTRTATKVPACGRNLAGQLRHLPLGALVGLLERGRYSGVLCAGGGDSFFSFEIQEGRVESWVRPAGMAAMEALPSALSLQDGEVRFHARSSREEAVDRVSSRLVRDVTSGQFAPRTG